MKNIIRIIVLSAFFMLSCNQNKTIDTSSIKIEGVSLDNSKLWKANLETTEGIKKMQNILNSFSENAALDEYKTLKTNLETTFSEIFQKCTMKGESHNQLHNYLKPMLPIFEAFESEDAKIRIKNYNQLKNHLAGYANYFE